MTSGDGAEVPKMIRRPMMVEYAAGSTLSPSRKTPGASSPLVHGADGVSSQVVLHDLPSEKKSFALSNGGREVLTELAVTATIVSIQMFIDKGIPKIKQRMAETRARKNPVKRAGPAAEPSHSTELADRGSEEIMESTPSMNSEQWFRLFFDALAHGAAGSAHQAISAEKWQVLASARVEDDEDTQALARGMRELTPELVSEQVDLVLQRHPELRDQDPAVVLRRLFGAAPDPEALRIQAGGGSTDRPQAGMLQPEEETDGETQN